MSLKSPIYTKKVALIGAPTDIGAGVRGVNLGPDAMRVADLAKHLQQQGMEVVDRGNLVGAVSPDLPPVEGYRHFDQVVDWNKKLHDAMYADLKEGNIPIMLGGDHCLAIGSIAAVARHCREQGKNLRVIWLDAHTDFNTSDLTPSGNIHGMPVACLCGFGPDELINMSDTVPAIDVSVMRQIGIRSVDELEKRFVNEKGLDVFDMRYIDEHGMRATMEKVLEGIDENTHIHVSFDVDYLDPTIAPAVGTTVVGGVSYREAQLGMEMIADTGCMGSLDIVELNPTLDEYNKTAILAVDLVESLFGKSTLVRDRSKSVK